LYLTRNIRNAKIERAPSSQLVVQTFIDGGFEVAAGVKQQLQGLLQHPVTFIFNFDVTESN
jgi:hypothetical protein